MKRIMVLKSQIGEKKGEVSEKQINEHVGFYFHIDCKYSSCLDRKLEVKQPNYIIIFLYNRGSDIKDRVLYGKYDRTKSKNIIYVHKLKQFKDTDITNVETSLYIEFKNIPNGEIHHFESVDVHDIIIDNLDTKIKDLRLLEEIKSGKFTIIEKNNVGDAVMKSYDCFEKNLDPLAQRSKYAKRVFGRMKPTPGRTEFQRDWERIIHSKSFRRLEDKAQIYTASKGNHFRTRLTHTLEVAQIARGLAREFRLNEDLVEAIALGHDLGHTPFGHVGERVLHDILLKDEKDMYVKARLYHGGFKHNFQSVRVVNYLEEKYGDFEGLDLTYQVMDGMLKHTKIANCKNKQNCDKCETRCYDIGEFICKGDKDKLYPNYMFATTLEGQIVACADEIAQRAHDLDDGIASGIIKIDKLIKDIETEGHGKIDKLYMFLKDGLKFMKNTNREYIDLNDVIRARIVSNVITFFMRELLENCQDNIKRYKSKLLDKLSNIDKSSEKTLNQLVEDLHELVIEEELIFFDNDTNDIIDELKVITSNMVINSEEVNCFDGKSGYIIKKLFEAYSSNPRQLPTGTIKRIHREISKYTNNCTNIRNGEIKIVNEEIEIYKGIIIENEEDLLKHKLFMRSLVDLISGMTDEFAKRQFNKLYIP